MGLVILGVFCMLWALTTAFIAIAKPEKMWKIGKIQGFVQMMGDTGATILFLVLAAGMGVLGVWLTFFL